MRVRLSRMLFNPKNHFSLFANLSLTANFSSKVTPQWPNIFFAENHADPATVQTLIRLVPVFRHLKFPYERFHDEAPGLTLDGRIAKIEENLQYAKYIQSKKLAGIALSNREQYLLSLYPTEPFWRLFYKDFKKEGINYKGIDSRLSRETVKRDEAMVRNSLVESAPFFGRIGLGHVIGMQENIICFGPKIAEHQYHFFYIYSKPLEDIGNIPFERSVREGGKNFPLSLTVIDGTKLTQDDIIRKICTEILQKKNKLEQINKEKLSETVRLTFKR